MVAINIRELSHNLSGYLRRVKKGEKIIVLERNIPIAEVVPHQGSLKQPGWKRIINKIRIKGPSLSQTIIKNRHGEKY